jgi:hypothetical protein
MLKRVGIVCVALFTAPRLLHFFRLPFDEDEEGNVRVIESALGGESASFRCQPRTLP